MTTNVRVPCVLGVAGILIFVAGCDAPQSANTSDPVVQTVADENVTTATGSPAGDFTVQKVSPGESWDKAVQPLIVRVSNQSFDDPDVNLSATLDGVALFDEVFAVEGQHAVTLFGVDVEPGSHTLTVVSDSGAVVEQAVDLPVGEQRWLVVDYWYFDPDSEGKSWGGEQEPGPLFTVSVSDKPVYIS